MENSEKTNQISNNKEQKKGFIITMEEAVILKFNVDVIAKENRKKGEKLSSTSHCIKQIRKVLSEAKAKRTVNVIE